MSTADVLATLACLSPQIKRKGKGGRQPAMDPRLDPNVDPKKAKRILANRLSAARSKMKQKSHVEVSLQAVNERFGARLLPFPLWLAVTWLL